MLTLAHAFYADVTLTGAQFTIKNNAPLSINDPLYKDQWYLKNTGQNGGIAGLDINVEPAWQLGYTGKGIKVGILDILVDANHPDLRDNLPAENVNDYFPKLNNCDSGTMNMEPMLRELLLGETTILE